MKTTATILLFLLPVLTSCESMWIPTVPPRDAKADAAMRARWDADAAAAQVRREAAEQECRDLVTGVIVGALDAGHLADAVYGMAGYARSLYREYPLDDVGCRARLERVVAPLRARTVALMDAGARAGVLPQDHAEALARLLDAVYEKTGFLVGWRAADALRASLGFRQ
jgi:hypothetical protein